MKQFLIIIFILQSFNLLAQTHGRFLHQYKKGKSIMLYSYVQRNDSSLIYGHVKERKSNTPIVNINIMVKDTNVGTVSDLGGNFTLFLPVQQGAIIFDKTAFTRFEFPFKFKKDNVKQPSSHH